MFIRAFNFEERKEVLFNTNYITKIEVEYAVPGNGPGGADYWSITLEEGLTNPEAKRFYRVFAAGEEYYFASNPNCPVIKVFEEIHKNAIKGRGPEKKRESGD